METKHLPLDLTFTKSRGRWFQIFKAFSDCPNFTSILFLFMYTKDPLISLGTLETKGGQITPYYSPSLIDSPSCSPKSFL